MDAVPKIRTKNNFYGKIKAVSVDFTKYKSLANGTECPDGMALTVNARAGIFSMKYEINVVNPTNCTMFTYKGEYGNYAKMRFAGNGKKTIEAATDYLNALNMAFPSEENKMLGMNLAEAMGTIAGAFGKSR